MNTKNDEKTPMKKKGCDRISWVLNDLWEEVPDAKNIWYDTRFPEKLMREELVVSGQTVTGGNSREHVVPLKFLLEEGVNIFESGGTTDDFSQILFENLHIVLMSKEERKYLDSLHKVTMPDGWRFGDDPFARLAEARIKWTPI